MGCFMYVCSCEFCHFCDFILPFCFRGFEFYFLPVVLVAEKCNTNWNHSEEIAKNFVYPVGHNFVCSKSNGINSVNSESLTF